MLSKRDSDQPMVDLQVRQDVEHQDLLESTLRHPVSDDGEDDGETEVGDEDLGSVFRLEDDGRRGKVCEGVAEHHLSATRDPGATRSPCTLTHGW